MAYIDNFGVQYSDDCKTLVKFPIDYSGSYKIPEGVEFIEKGAFKEQYGIGGQPQYMGCDGLLSIAIPDSLMDIDTILRWCKNLQQILVDASNPFYCIENGVLFDKSKVIMKKYLRTEPQDYYVVPDSVQEIGEYAFANKTNVVSVDLRRVKFIGEHAFESCINMVSIKMPEVQDIGQKAFCLCSSLSSVKLPIGLKRINSSVFDRCTALASVDIPDSLLAIDNYAFYGCENLTSISIPESVEYIDISSSAFDNSGISKTEANWENDVLYIGHFLVKASRYLYGTYVVKEGTRQICKSAFRYCTELVSVILPEGVVYVDNYAFSKCEQLSKVYLPGTLKVIGEDAFAGSGLARVRSTESLKSPSDCIYLDEGYVRIPDGVVTIGDGAFSNCLGIRSIVFSKGMNKLSDRVCFGCKNLHTVHLSSTIESIGDFVFCGCTALQYIELPDSLLAIGKNVFENCNSLEEIVTSRRSQDRFRVMEGLEDMAYIIIGRYWKNDGSSNIRSWDELKNIWQGIYHSLEGGETERVKENFELLRNGFSSTTMPPIGVCLSTNEYRFYKAEGYDLQSINAWCWSGKDIHKIMRLHLDKVVGTLTPRVGYYKVVGTDAKEGEKPARLYCYYIVKPILKGSEELDFLEEIVEINPSPLYNYYSYGPKNAEIKEGDIIKVLSNDIRDLHRTEGKTYVIHWEFCNIDNSRDMSSFSGNAKKKSAWEIEEMRYAMAEERFWDDYLDQLNRR